MKIIIILLSLNSFICFSQIDAPSRDYNNINNRINRGEFVNKPSTTTNTSSGYRPSTEHFNTFAPVNTEMTKEQIKSFERLFGFKRKTQAELDSIYYVGQKIMKNEKKERIIYEQKERDLQQNIQNWSSNIDFVVENYFNKIIFFLNQNNKFNQSSCIKGDGKNGISTFKGANYVMLANVKNGIKNGNATIIFENAPITQINCYFTNDELNGDATILYANEKYDASYINLKFSNNKIVERMTLFYNNGSYATAHIIKNTISGLASYKHFLGANAVAIYHLGSFKTLLSGYDTGSKFSYWPETIFKDANNKEIQWSKEAATTSVETVKEGDSYITTKTTSYGKKKPKLFAAWANGNSYYGTFNGNKMSGGTYVGAKNWVYEGEFKNDKMVGQGTVYWTDGSSYTGEWKNDQRNGEGTVTKTNGFYKKGTFKDNEDKNVKYYNAKNEEITKEKYNVFVENGFGQEQINDDESYEGFYANGMLNGAGVYRFKTGLYEGNFVDGKFSGQGVKKYNDGESYTGNFKEDQFFGKGKYIEKDGTIYEGDFENGKLNGNGIKTFKNGTYIKGTFKDWEILDVKYYNNKNKEITKLEFDAK